jgi:hypothetical protein
MIDLRISNKRTALSFCCFAATILVFAYGRGNAESQVTIAFAVPPTVAHNHPYHTVACDQRIQEQM